MTFEEFISAITNEFVDRLDEEKAMAYIKGADIETLLRALETRGVTRSFLLAIQNELADKVPKAQIEAALTRVVAEVSKRHGMK